VSAAEVSFACAWALVDELVRGGVAHACVSPGSRSTALALALDRHAGVTVHVHLDERSSAFVALGLAKALRQPVAVACTSGTAAAELFPAVVEASQSRVPLILLTADRPPRLRGTGANQTIDQVELYGRYVRWFAEAPVPSNSADGSVWGAIGTRAIHTARRGHLPDETHVHPPGPVHVNCPFEEPPTSEVAEATLHPSTPEPFVQHFAFDGQHHPEIELNLRESGRGMIVVGGLDRPREAILDLGAALGVPVLAEPMSGLRRPDRAMAAGQQLASAILGRPDLAPDVIVQFGATPTSRATQGLIAASGYRIVVAGGDQLDPDPEGIATHRIEAYGEHWLPEIVGTPSSTDRTPWLLQADAAVRSAVDRLLDSWDEPSEMRVARDLAAAIPDGGTLFVGNSMPVRDLDAFMAPRDGLRVLGNRGASGIDGLLSTALGVAASGTGPTFALLGDLSFLYDAGALLWNAKRGLDLVVVVNDNAGGQIFAGLGQRDLPAEELERLFVTPHGVDLEQLCAAAGAGHTRVERSSELVPALDAAAAAGGLRVVQVAIDADRDRARRAELRDAVNAAIARVDPHPST
jgi:2-succinyl-5-enolpyruvyl-6-hydroxy-3-cyclohexene-1-carboxylate synthase